MIKKVLFFLLMTTNAWAVCTQTQYSPFTGKLDYCESAGTPFTAADAQTATGWIKAGSNVYLNTSTDNVGIGTSLPIYKLEIQGSGAEASITNTDNSYRISFGFPSLGGGNPVLSAFVTGITNGRVLQRQSSTNNIYLGDIDDNNGDVIVRSGGNDLFRLNNSGNVSINNTSGNPNVTVLNAGNVGIGTDLPLANLHVSNNLNIGTNLAGFTGVYSFVINTADGGINLHRTGTNEAFIMLATDSGGSGGQLRALDGGGLRLTDVSSSEEWARWNGTRMAFVSSGVIKAYFGMAAAADNLITGTATGDSIIRNEGGKIVFSTDSGTTAHVTMKGANVGIGTSVPQARLTVQGSGTTTAKAFVVQNSSAAEKVTVLDNGNVGIGSTNPSAALDIRTNTSILRWGTDTDHIGFLSSSGTIAVMGAFSNDLAFYANLTEYMRLTSTGNVGIGTSAPIRTLSIYGTDVNTSPGINLRSAASNGQSYSFLSTTTNSGLGAGKLVIYDETNAATRFIIHTDGNVGIGGVTAPAAKLVVQGSGTTTAKALQVQNSSAAVKVTIQDDGNVGIGTTVPSAPLSVTGHIHTHGTAPTVSSCGTSPGTVAGTDHGGRLTIGTVAASSCTLTFAQAFRNAPNCFCNDESQVLVCRAVATTTTLTLSVAVSFIGDVVTYGCEAYE